MLSIKIESFLFDYFLYVSVTGEYANREKAFYELGEIWNVDVSDLSSIYRETESENVLDISTESEYMRYRRIKQYNAMIGIKEMYSKSENEIIAIKGDAIRVVAQYAMQATKETSQTVIYKTLIRNAQSGNIIALRILGIMECSGIFCEGNKEAGLEYLRKAMKWGDITATLAVLKYDNGNKRLVLSMLKSETKGTLYKFLVDEFKVIDGEIPSSYNEELLLLRKTFDVKKTNADLFNPMYARLIYSPILSIKDKEKILFSERNDLLSEVCDLPLHLMNVNNIAVGKNIFQQMAINREEERKNVIYSLQNADLCTTPGYKPLCVCSDSDYVLESYVSEICKAFTDVNIERIEIADLRDYDFEPTQNNVFLRSLSENKRNILLLVFKGEINDKAIDLTKAVIQTSNRKKFRLSSPSVTLDISSVLPICVSDKCNIKKLNGLVDVVSVAKLNEQEKRLAVKEIVNKKINENKVELLSVDETVFDRLSRLPIESVRKLVDKLIRERRTENGGVNLTVESIKPYVNRISDHNYGFGGVINEG